MRQTCRFSPQGRKAVARLLTDFVGKNNAPDPLYSAHRHPGASTGPEHDDRDEQVSLDRRKCPRTPHWMPSNN
jgi:hypothetical protein